MQPPETMTVSTTSVACDGGEGPLGHPRVYLTLARNGRIDCPYCGRRYVWQAAAPARTGWTLDQVPV